MAYKCPDCNTNFYGDFCPKCAKLAADCIEMPEVETEEEKKAQEAAEASAVQEKKAQEAEATGKGENAENGQTADGQKQKCPKCGAVFSGKFCPECGTQIKKMDKCPVCGTERKGNEKFCSNCGYSYERKSAALAGGAAGIATSLKNTGKKALAFAKRNKKRLIIATAAIAIILAIVVPVSVVFTSPVHPANVDRINIGDTQDRVLSIIGEPYGWEEGDTTFTYYSDNYLKIRKQLDEIANMEDIGSFSDLADALEKEEELNQKLETLEYKRTTVTFDEGGLVTQIVYNASIVDNVSQPKELKSQEVITESVRIYEVSDVVYTLKYDDGSIYKSIASVTADTSNKFLFEVYDPFSESGAKISMECSVVENPDVTYIVGEEGATYLLDQYGNLTISGSGSITSRDISRFDKGEIKQVTIEGNITEIGEGAFSGCALMTSVSIPDSVTKVGRNAFSDCSSLTYRTYDDVRYLGNEGNPYLVAVEIADTSAVQFNIHANAKVIADYAFAGNTVLRAAYIPDGSVKYIGARAFYDCTSMTGITLGNGVENIGDNAFSNCNLLTSIAIPGSASIGEYAFSSCYALTSITISDGVTNIGEGAFSSCTEVQKISIPSSLETVGDRIFINYPSVSKVTRIDFSGDLEAWLKVMSLGGMSSFISEDSAIYLNGEQLSGDIIVPEGITSIPSYAFTNFTQITSLTIPDSVTSIGSYILQGCTGIESLIIPNMTRKLGGYFGEDPRYDSYNTQVPDSLKTLVITGGESIPQHAFYGCSGLTSITMPDSVTSIGGSAFSGCSDLTSITIPDSVTSIGDYVFRDCSGLTSITIPDSVTSIGYGAFFGCSGIIQKENGVSYVDKWVIYCDNTVSQVQLRGDTAGIAAQAFSDCSGLTSITIPDSVTSIGQSAFSGCSGLTSIIIPDSVTSIGSYAFRDCSGLTSITIPDSVTSIGSGAFSGCSGLTSITIPYGVTSIGDEAFSGCRGLTSITIPGSVTSIGYRAFYNCNGLTSITIPDSVTIIRYEAFRNCSGLTSITIPDSVTSIEYNTFYNCRGLTSITIPDSVTSIGSSAFEDCSGLTSITIPDSVTSIGSSAFSYCSGLTSVTIPDSVTNIGDESFSGCSGLTSVTIPDSVTSIGSGAFSACSGLTSITVEQGNAVYHSAANCIIETASGTLIAGCKNSVIPDDGSITSIGSYAFSSCSGLTSITIPDSVTSIGSYAFRNCSGLTSITIPNSVTSIGERAFYDCSGLTSITIPNSVTSIGSYAFQYCNALTIYCEVASKPSGWSSSWNYSNCPVVWNCNNNEADNDGNIYYIAENGIRYALNNGTAAVIRQSTTLSGKIIIPEEIVYKNVVYFVTSIGTQAFYDCSGLTSITIPDSVTSIRSLAFSGCSGLTSITIPNSVTSIGTQAFYDCSGLTSITIPDSVTSIGYNTFNNCSGVTSITVEQGNAVYHSAGNCIIETASGTLIAGCKNSVIPDDGSVTSIGSSAFRGCSGLTSITIPDSVTSIGWDAFYNCSGLTSITIPDSVTSIKSDAFSGCSGLTSITIPDSVTSIGSRAFYNCSDLTSIAIPFVGSGDSSNTHFGYIFGASGYSDNSDYVPSTLKEVTITGGTSIGSYAFYGCSGLLSITIPDSVTSIGRWAFSGCSGLTSITIPDSVTSIGDVAFIGCSGLTSITIPDSVTSIGNRVFYDCSGLTRINYQGNMAQWMAISKGSWWADYTGDFTIACTDGVLDKEGNQV